MKLVYSVALSSLVLFACSEQQKSNEQADKEETKKEQQLPNVIPSHILTMDVSGMSCEMACGGSIRKGLMETGAVARVQFDFEMGRDVNKAIISYDDSKISEEEMKSIVTDLNDKQFTVGTCEDKELESDEVVTSSAKKPAQESTNKISMSTEEMDISLPNLADLFRSIRL